MHLSLHLFKTISSCLFFFLFFFTSISVPNELSMVLLFLASSNPLDCADILSLPPPPPPLLLPFLYFNSHAPLCVCLLTFPLSGMERDIPYDPERSSDRRFPVKKPTFPQHRNRSLDFSAGTGCVYLLHSLSDACGMTTPYPPPILTLHVFLKRNCPFFFFFHFSMFAIFAQPRFYQAPHTRVVPNTLKARPCSRFIND